MPVVAPVVSESNVLCQSVEASRTLAMRLVVGNRLGHLLEGFETVGILVHKIEDLVCSISFYPRSHIDENEGRRIDEVFSDGDEAGPTTHRGASEYRVRFANLVKDGDEVRHLRVLRIDTVLRPVGIAVPPGVKGNGVVAGFG
jgi:hypothetical protein